MIIKIIYYVQNLNQEWAISQKFIILELAVKIPQKKENLKDFIKEANILKELEGPGFFPKVINYSEDAPIKKSQNQH